MVLPHTMPHVCCFVQSNFIGTEFQILDGGERVARRPSPLKRQGSFLGGPRHQLPSAAQGASTETAEGRAGSPEDGGRSELGLVQYHMNVMGTKGPRKMVIGVPYVDFDSNVPMKWTGGTRMARCVLPGTWLHRLMWQIVPVYQRVDMSLVWRVFQARCHSPDSDIDQESITILDSGVSAGLPDACRHIVFSGRIGAYCMRCTAAWSLPGQAWHVLRPAEIRATHAGPLKGHTQLSAL